MKISVITPTIRGDEGLFRPRRGLKRQTMRECEWLVERHDPNDPPNFNAAMNNAIRKARGELIVFLQDFIEPKSFGLKMFWKAYQEEPNVFWTAPVGQTMDDEMIDWDWRKDCDGSDRNFMEWEIDWAAAPRDALIRIGGFDEELDKQWGFDNVNVGLRATMAGYRIKCLPKNRAVALDHRQMMGEHEYSDLRDVDFHNRRLDEIRRGLQLSYLT